MRTRKIVGPRGHPTEITASDERVMLRVPLGTPKELLGWLWVEYRRSDPLVVTLSVRAPSRAVALERTLLRTDLRSIERVAVRYATVWTHPGVRGLTAIVFAEKQVSVTMLVPTEAIRRFVDATDELVPPGRGETEALADALVSMLHAPGNRQN
jgi:hypothetical protein